MNSRICKTPKYFIVYHPETKNYERIAFKEPSAVSPPTIPHSDSPQIQINSQKCVVTAQLDDIPEMEFEPFDPLVSITTSPQK